MKLRIFKLPRLFQLFCPTCTWEKKSGKKNIYLTFDDGPHPEVTLKILDILDHYNFKATFFCVGKNIVEHPEVFELLKIKGHAVGNHTYDHLNGWKNSTEVYLQNIKKCEKLTGTGLFRAPYGKIRFSQLKKLKSLGYEIVFWSLMSFDFDKEISPARILSSLKKNTFPGAIVVFHDSKKAENNVLSVLPGYLEFLKAENYVGEGL